MQIKHLLLALLTPFSSSSSSSFPNHSQPKAHQTGANPSAPAAEAAAAGPTRCRGWGLGGSGLVARPVLDGLGGGGYTAAALVCAAAATVIALVHIYRHLLHYAEPIYQRFIVRLIFMVPVMQRSSSP